MAEACDREALNSRVTFEDTATTLTLLAGRLIPFHSTSRPLPRIQAGDQLLQAKLRDLRSRPESGFPVPVERLEFLLIRYGDSI